MRRFGQVIRVKPEKLEYYKELHADPCQERMNPDGPEWWHTMTELFHCG